MNSTKIFFLGRVAGSSSDVQKELSQQMEQISEQHQKQLATLRDEIRTKETQMETLKE
jgi:Skp family chaperone for outer membrane proteins